MSTAALARLSATVAATIVGAAPTSTAVSSTSDDSARRGSRIAFLRNDRVFFMNPDGSGKRRANLPSIPTWSRDRLRMAFFRQELSGTRLYVANADGSGRREILREGPYSCLNPAWSPDGSKLLYTRDCDVDFQRVGIVNRDGSGRRILTDRWSMNPAWSPDGRAIVFTRSPRAQRGRFRLFLMNSRGKEQRQIQGRYSDPEPTPNSRTPVWSRDGRTIFFLTVGDELMAIGRTGARPRNLARPLAKVRDFDLSPDGRQLVLSAPGSPDRGWEIFTVNVDGSGLRKLTENRAYDIEPRWSPDGKRIAFTSMRDGNFEVYVMNADGSGQTNISRSRAEDSAPSWAPVP